ncbi:Glycerol-3-phosphate dehydrogenase/dihydroxyacetone 3-phosphate reductase [Pseudoloma neurophilia]|uniref:Glycerol-3-phosphate dehydrogenase [NAD(+)] n=1 Tax=Pseudoloma neurophilia TaxID=146866 RepID=A0A0R0LWT8_9MICR|nr:Glycerol-3-phosphate dehydrogenase/dihydroxyacetone 3-phosphate reductase [Pseudoloma neurophilia]
MKYRVGIIGGGNFGTAVGNILSTSLLKRHSECGDKIKNADGTYEFDKEVKIWIYDEKTELGGSLCQEINEKHENFKYLPGIPLKENLKFVTTDEDYKKLLKESDILVYVLPTFIAKKFALDLKKYDIRNKEIITLMKGFIAIENKKPILFSEFVDSLQLGHKVSALMGANIANQMHKGPCEMTFGIKNNRMAAEDLFTTEITKISVINDNIAVELCGALKNIVAIAFGICDGLGLNVNTQMSILRKGLLEMNEFTRLFKERSGIKTEKSITNVNDHVMFQSCGIPDLFVTCISGRNSNGGKRIGQGETVKQIEDTMNGQKIHGVCTAEFVYDYLMMEDIGIQKKFPLFLSVYEIAKEIKKPSEIQNII